jgi:hypothetical protein
VIDAMALAALPGYRASDCRCYISLRLRRPFAMSQRQAARPAMIAPHLAHAFMLARRRLRGRDGRVRLRPTYPATCAALTLAAVLCGCAAPDIFDKNEHWFAKPFDITGHDAGYTFSELQESHEKGRPVAANDLVSGNGACPPPPEAAVPAPAGAPGAGPGSAPVALAPGAGDSPAAAPAAPSLLGAAIALGMTECEVVWRVGAPSSVQIGSNPNGDRTALLTFDSGPRAGMYHFERGRLRAMDSAAASAARSKVSKRERRAPSRTEQISTE